MWKKQEQTRFGLATRALSAYIVALSQKLACAIKKIIVYLVHGQILF